MSKITRRNFIKYSSMSLAAASFAPSLTACQMIGKDSLSTGIQDKLQFVHVTDTHLDLGTCPCSVFIYQNNLISTFHISHNNMNFFK